MSFVIKNGKFIVRNDGRVNDFDTLHDALLYMDYIRFLRSL
jgi:hypothetical protein